MAPVRPRDADNQEETEGLLRGPSADEEVLEDEERDPPSSCLGGDKPALSSVVIIPAQSKITGPSSPQASRAAEPDAGDTLHLCRICLEEDTISNLDAPCACSGTQRWAHQACIQRWVEEKGNLKCEVCGQLYKGDYEAPPPPPPGANPPMPPMFFVDPAAAARLTATRQQIQILEEQDEYQQRHPGISCVFTACVFILFLVVMHHTMVIADGDDGTFPPAPSAPPMPDQGPVDTDGLTMFLFWVGTKAFMIGIPLWIMLRVAARQARREQYEAMLRGVAYDSNRRMVFRMQTYSGAADGVPVPPRGVNAV